MLILYNFLVTAKYDLNCRTKRGTGPKCSLLTLTQKCTSSLVTTRLVVPSLPRESPLHEKDGLQICPS